MPLKIRSSPKHSKQKTQISKLDVKYALAWLEENSSRKIRDEMLPRYGINARKAFGVSVANLHKLAKIIGRNHELALALWETGWYDARMLAALIDEPERVTAVQMDKWCRDFDNWGICDTVCFHLSTAFLTPIARWSNGRGVAMSLSGGARSH